MKKVSLIEWSPEHLKALLETASTCISCLENGMHTTIESHLQNSAFGPELKDVYTKLDTVAERVTLAYLQAGQVITQHEEKGQ